MVVAKKKGANPCKSIGSKFQSIFIGGLEKGFQKYGEAVSRWPVAFIIGSIVICAICSSGIMLLEENTNGNELWVPQDSDFKENGDFVAASGALAGGGTGGGAWPQSCQSSAQGGCQVCIEGGILELWANNGSYDATSQASIDALTDASLLAKINDQANLVSGITGQKMSIEQFLGGLEKDGTGQITAARATKFNFVGRLHEDALAENETQADLDFETRFIEIGNNFTLAGVTAYVNAARSFGDVLGGSIGGDVNMLALGYLIVILYVMAMLGKFNSVEQRALLSLTGIMAVGMGIGSAYGFCSYVGLDYTGLHSILPFLLLGIGIDDMFVIVQSFDNLKDGELALALAQRFGLCMSHAGVAITITSVTDLLAFGIGGTTVLPALMSFCLFAAMGILFVFGYMITFFLGWFVLDQRRLEDVRDGFICCWKKSDWSPNKCSQTSLMTIGFKKFADTLIRLWAKIVIFILTLVIFGISLYFVFQLETSFESTDFINEGTYLRGFIEASAEHFPNSGISGNIFIGDSENILNNLDEVQALMTQVSEDESLNQFATRALDSFPFAFKKWMDANKPASTNNAILRTYLTEFLHTSGRPFRNNIIFKGELVCTDPAPPIKIITLGFTHKAYEGVNEHIDKINAFEDSIKKWSDKFGANARVFAYSALYANYVTMEIISEELLRNIGLALLCVFIATLILIGDLLASIIVVITVVMVLVDVSGFMYLWGLSVDTVAAVLLTIAMGLSVDYSAHIAHSFMVNSGSRNDRIHETLVEMGPAVLNGGFSTFLAFALLMTAQSYVFQTFFKIFFLVVVFGVFHGLVFLPVVLSLIGPGTIGKENSISPVTPITRVASAWEGKGGKPNPQGKF
ncbi:hypothetical protein TCAL_08010 [Tigriopus californicus]|uniref:SSD domain-containing protein n=1 Tax=Tigriopus californicus TaxID=6832 RepID=A0A553PIE3_TIGCA|nr:hypothetical protein TCAL_08010 [Tigriopus californicus]